MLSRQKSQIKVITEVALFVFLVLFAFALWVYRDTLFQALYDPGQPFQTYQPPAAAGYNSANGWIALPDLSIDPETLPDALIGKGDIFVVTPTLYLGGDGWVAPVDDPEFNADFDRIITPNYVTPYHIAGRVFSPRYRQAALYTFLNKREDARLSQNFAYGDVKRAFDVFLANRAPERPIVLIGHGQGGLHVQKLLTEYFTGERAAQLAAAYIIDHPTPLSILPDSLGVCESETDVNCVVSFGAFSPRDDEAAEQFLVNTLVFDNGRLRNNGGVPLVCVNPLLWTAQSDYAPARLHKGAVAAEGLGPDAAPAPARRQFGAQCEDGVLLIDKPRQRSLRRPARFGGHYRTLAANLFYEDLRQNITARVDALIATDTLPRRAPLLSSDDEIEIIESPVTLPDE